MTSVRASTPKPVATQATTRPAEAPSPVERAVSSATEEVKGWVSNAYSKAKDAKTLACGVYEGGKDDLRNVTGKLGTTASVLGVTSVGLTATGVGAPVAAVTGTAAGAIGTVSTVLNGVDAAGRALCEGDLGGVKDMAVSYVAGKALEKVAPMVQQQLGKLTGQGGAKPGVPAMSLTGAAQPQALTAEAKQRLTHLMAKPVLVPEELRELRSLLEAQKASAFAAAQATTIELPKATTTAAKGATTGVASTAAKASIDAEKAAVSTAAKSATDAEKAAASTAAKTATAAMTSKTARAATFEWPELNLKRAGMTELVDKAGVPIRGALADASAVRGTKHTVEEFYSNVKGFSTQVGNTFDWQAGRELQRFAERQGSKALTKADVDTLGKALDATIATAEKAVAGKPERTVVLEALKKVRDGLGQFSTAVGREGTKSIAISNIKVGPDWAL